MTSSFLAQNGFSASSIGSNSAVPTAGVGTASMLPEESRTHSSAMMLGAVRTSAIALANAARQCVLIDGSPDHLCRCPVELPRIGSPGKDVYEYRRIGDFLL